MSEIVALIIVEPVSDRGESVENAGAASYLGIYKRYWDQIKDWDAQIIKPRSNTYALSVFCEESLMWHSLNKVLMSISTPSVEKVISALRGVDGSPYQVIHHVEPDQPDYIIVKKQPNLLAAYVWMKPGCDDVIEFARFYADYCKDMNTAEGDGFIMMHSELIPSSNACEGVVHANEWNGEVSELESIVPKWHGDKVDIKYQEHETFVSARVYD